jgi:hypothetical protein
LERSRRILGVVLICVSIVALFSWEKWGRSRFIYDDVLVLTQNVDKGEKIDEDMVRVVRQERVSSGMLQPSDRKWLAGKEAAQFIKGGMPLFSEYFSEAGLVADPSLDRYALKIPETWIDSIPDSMGRTDRAYFYFDGRFITAAVVSWIDEDKKSFDVIVSSRQAEAISRLAADGGRFVISCS